MIDTLVIPYIVAGLVLVTVVGILIHKVLRALRRPDLHYLDRNKIKETWQQIQTMSEQGNMGAKVAVIEADKLLDLALKSMLMPGETLGERLKVAAYKYPSIRNVWPAHKLRNQLVHEATFEISPRQAKQALNDFEKALKSLNVMD
ncbi:hypothetical protein FJZ48_01235 [Candidatus Uhrbacteria bacterium]|nr:hypothetical protein [Candidatus Uhrbacteria bacterium]